MTDKQLEFAWMRDGQVLVGYNPRSEEGGWVPVGDVTRAVRKIEAERDEALALLEAASKKDATLREMIDACRNILGAPNAD